jgi:lauroyl/myristoyl acyltransferase
MAAARVPSASRRRPSASATLDFIWVLQHYPLRWLVRACPEALLGGVRIGVTALHRLLRRDTRRRAAREMSAMLGVPAEDSARLAHRFIGHVAQRAYLDLRIFARRAPLCETLPVIAGAGHLDTAIAAGRGAVLVAVHRFANVAGLLTLRDRGYPVLTLKGASRWRPATSLWERTIETRHRRNLEAQIPERVDPNDPDAPLTILRRLRGGGLVSIHPDIWRNTSPVPFLGGVWPVNGGLLEVARLTGCAVLPIECAYEGRGLRIDIHPPLPLATDGSPEACAARNFPLLVAELERQVRRHPDQWGRWALL